MYYRFQYPKNSDAAFVSYKIPRAIRIAKLVDSFARIAIFIIPFFFRISYPQDQLFFMHRRRAKVGCIRLNSEINCRSIGYFPSDSSSWKKVSVAIGINRFRIPICFNGIEKIASALREPFLSRRVGSYPWSLPTTYYRRKHYFAACISFPHEHGKKNLLLLLLAINKPLRVSVSHSNFLQRYGKHCGTCNSKQRENDAEEIGSQT